MSESGGCLPAPRLLPLPPTCGSGRDRLEMVLFPKPSVPARREERFWKLETRNPSRCPEESKSRVFALRTSRVIADALYGIARSIF